jgi:hypothetical protein
LREIRTLKHEHAEDNEPDRCYAENMWLVAIPLVREEVVVQAIEERLLHVPIIIQ